MISNLTSQALKAWSEKVEIFNIKCPHFGFPIVSIANKYECMENFLSVIKKESHRHFSGEEFSEVNDILRNIYIHACGAIEYDPLVNSGSGKTGGGGGALNIKSVGGGGGTGGYVNCPIHNVRYPVYDGTQQCPVCDNQSNSYTNSQIDERFKALCDLLQYKIIGGLIYDPLWQELRDKFLPKEQ